jgi:hypothetical protein
MSASWLDCILLGAIFMIYGLMTCFEITWWVTLLLFLILLISFMFGLQSLKRFVMRKQLGYVSQKGAITSFRQELSRKQFLGILIPLLIGFCIPIITLWKHCDDGIAYIVMFLVGAFILIIIGLINRKRAVFYSIFYMGVYYLVCALIWIFPMEHILHTHEIAPQGIIFIFLGFGLMLCGIIRYFEYKKIIQKVKGTN